MHIFMSFHILNLKQIIGSTCQDQSDSENHLNLTSVCMKHKLEVHVRAGPNLLCFISKWAFNINFKQSFQGLEPII